MMDKQDLLLAGKLVFSEKPGTVMRITRMKLGVSQRELAGKLEIMPTTLSDYESNRRINIGANVIRRWVRTINKRNQ